MYVANEAGSRECWRVSRPRPTVDGDDLAEDDSGPISLIRFQPAYPNKTTHEIRFFVRIRGARTPPPKIDAPVTKIPLRRHQLAETT